MDGELENLSRKVDAIYDVLVKTGIPCPLPMSIAQSMREAELEQAVRKAIEDLDRTKSSFKSKRIMLIKEELARAVAKKS
jgi:hypothetical protein